MPRQRGVFLMIIEELDESIELMMTKLELEGQTCGLKHSKYDPSENHPAVDYLCQGLGNPKTNSTKQKLKIPVCAECAEALYNTDWILVYCVYCNRSQWIYRPRAKNDYPKGNIIYWLDVCPHCAEVVNEWQEGEK